MHVPKFEILVQKNVVQARYAGRFSEHVLTYTTEINIDMSYMINIKQYLFTECLFELLQCYLQNNTYNV